MNLIPLLALSFAQAPASDPQAVLDASLAKVSKAQTIVGSVVFPKPPNGGAQMETQFEFAKPNRFVTIFQGSEMRCDGKTHFVLDTKKHEYDSFPVGDRTMPRFAWGFDSFFGLPAGAFTMDHPVAGTFAGKSAVIAEFHSEGLRTTCHVAFDPDSNLPLGFTLGAGENAHDYEYKGVKLNEPIADTEFAWRPTDEWQKKVPMGENLLKVGVKAPDFEILTPEGKKVTLSKALEGKKGLLLNFWFVGCNPCRQEFPHLQAMFPGLKDQGFAYLSVNQGDAATAVTKFIKESKYTFPVALNGTGDADVVTKYGVPAFPTNFIIAPDRTVVARFVGFDEDGLKSSIRKLGLKLE